MSLLPVLSGREVVGVFVALGWELARQRGSHIPRCRHRVPRPSDGRRAPHAGS
jgi:predicted RNA binding protein YcfA (HicA-like mRNA interferase family)